MSATTCAACHGVRLRFDSVVVLGDYRGQLREEVLRMKQPGQEPLSLAMGELLFAERQPQLADIRADVVAPVPMHWTRRMMRGTNSPELVAAALSRRLRIPLLKGALARRRNTRQQGSLPRGQRAANIRGAFVLSAGYDLSGASVLLVDDVMTTGATCSEAAATLLRGGAARVAVAVIARASSGV
jgi:ComF family protein